ncbi:DUF481 domain-containing protein [Fulvivirga sedimenti]|uniref:DUF481 domain-containing protein n=1 Tax=Fulvivirga sedimenti TaxID=2879465 RepID=A0A9X1HKS2_9BACT|nr:DUF481 domain-containing protein [Fulvivirga sedimenti]MCA6073993.1 DUF481 domain-containing protein [Fulvivirga sedimenti]
MLTDLQVFFPLYAFLPNFAAMRTFLLTCFVLGLMLSGPVSGQILRVNKNNLNADSSRFWLGAFTFNFNLNNRSVSAENENAFIGLTASADLVYVADKNAYILINQINYFTSSDQNGAFISTGYAHFRINWLRKKRLSYENYVQTQYDRGRNMPQRVLMGGGIRYRLVDEEKKKLIVGTGAMFERERWKEPENESNIIEKNFWKNSSYINGFIFITEDVKLDIITYYQGGYDYEADLFRNRINGDIVLSFNINKKLSFNAEFSGQFEDRPIIAINKFIYSVKNGIKWAF